MSHTDARYRFEEISPAVCWNKKNGKPTFHLLENGPKAARHDMSTFVALSSWLVFDILELTGPQDWLLDSVSTWHLAPDIQKDDFFTQTRFT